MTARRLDLTFLGSGDAFGSGGRFQTCLHLAAGDVALLVDCGASSLVAMKRAALDPSTIGLVVLTHLHGDHFGGLPFLILDGQFTRRTHPLVIAGPPGVRARVEAAMEVMFPGSTGVTRRFAVEYVELGDAPVALGPASIAAVPVLHPSGAPALAVRLECEGRAVGYSGDTEWTETLLDAARGTAVFVCEAYTFERKVRNHLDWATVRANRDRLGCKRLILTHLGPEMLARLGDVDAECAEDSLVLRL